ncbi:hypothetical protein KCU99_g3905, partial [Aureobasidium melanogenum]
MISNPSILLSALAFGSVQAFDTGTYGLGYWNESYAFEANAHPNATNSVPFQLGSGNYTLQVNVAELTPTGFQALPNQRQAASFYNLIWDGGKSLNQSIRDAVTTGTGEGVPRLCLTVPLGSMSRKATNGYREQDAGDCSNALGKQCMQDLKKVDVSSFSSTTICDPSWMPKSCISRFGDGGLGGIEVVDPHVSSNDTDGLLQSMYSPVEFSYYSSQLFSAGNESYYQREDERLHAIFFSGSWGVTSVCNRVNNTKLAKDNIAVYQGAAVGRRASVGISVMMAVAVVMFML